MDPRSVGIPSNTLVLGKLSGRAGLRARLEELGYHLTQEDLNSVFQEFKDLADKKREVNDRDLEALMSDHRRSEIEICKLDHVQVSCGDHDIATATVRIIDPDGRVLTDAGTGTGPWTRSASQSTGYSRFRTPSRSSPLASITEGTDALGEVTIRIARDDQDIHRPGILHRHHSRQRQGLRQRPEQAHGDRGHPGVNRSHQIAGAQALPCPIVVSLRRGRFANRPLLASMRRRG